MILIIDNYDSFTYNLVQYVKQIGPQVKVFRNDAITISEIKTLNPAGIIISPGPGNPDSAGISVNTIKEFSGKIPILGVCLGHQSIVAAFGGEIISAKKLMHGKTSLITADGKKIYKGIDKPFDAMRYHSLAASAKKLPDCLYITAKTEEEEIMGVRHKKDLTEGIQFHPESIMTPVGKKLLKNFLNLTDKA